MDSLLTQFEKPFEKALLSIDRISAQKLIAQACKNTDAVTFVEHVVVPVLEKIGVDWEKGRIALSQVYMSGRICEDLVDTILPADNPQRKCQPKMAIAVLNDYHSLGKIILYSSIRASGFELLDFGRVDVEELVQKVVSNHIRILLISVLMFPSALQVKDLCKLLKQQGSEVKVVVGGAPFRFDKQLWREVGADATGENIADALKIVNQIMEELS